MALLRVLGSALEQCTVCSSVKMFIFSLHLLMFSSHTVAALSQAGLIRLAAGEKVEVGPASSSSREGCTSRQGLCFLSVTLSSLGEEPAMAPTLGGQGAGR